MAKKKPVKEVGELRRLMEEKGLSPAVAARFIGCSGRQVYRWISGEFEPTPLYRKAISEGIERMRRELNDKK